MNLYKIYSSYDELKEAERKIYEELVEDEGYDLSRASDDIQLIVYDTLEDFAYYEVTERYLFGEPDVFTDKGPVPLEAYIDFESLGEDLSHITDPTVYFFSTTGKVVENIDGF